MATLTNMPQIVIDPTALAQWGGVWLGTTGSTTKAGAATTKEANCFDRKQSMDFGKTVIDPPFAASLATMLGGIPVRVPVNSEALLPPISDCVEIGDTRIIGGVRPQNFDVAYRPDGVRLAYDSKTLNDKESVKKNWQNMINDLATEATTVHTRFPYALVCFVVVIPRPALMPSQEFDILRTLERLGARKNVLDQNHLAEAISLIIWDPATGTIDNTVPNTNSNLRLDKLSDTISDLYLQRYKGLPPHDKS